MTNVQKLKKGGVIEKKAKLSKEQTKAINALSSVEVFALLQMKKKVPNLGGMKFDAGGGIF